MSELTAQDWIFYGALAPIVLCSLAGLAVSLERFSALRRGRILPEGFLVEFGDLIARKAYAEAGTLCRKHDSPAGRVLGVVAAYPQASRAELKERLEEVGARESVLLERGVGALSTIATVSPLLGLLGTVIGLVLIFGQATGSDSLASPEQLAGGISTALYTTVFGLIVAIPAVLVGRYLHARAEALALELEAYALDALDVVTSRREG